MYYNFSSRAIFQGHKSYIKSGIRFCFCRIYRISFDRYESDKRVDRNFVTAGHKQTARAVFYARA